jgi:hypothetical protein
MKPDHRHPDQLGGGGPTGSPLANSFPLLFFTLSYDHLCEDLWSHMHDVPPVLVAASTCYRGGKLRARPVPRKTPVLFCDSGGYLFAKNFQQYPFTSAAYIAWLQQMQPNYAAMLDYPCEHAVAPDRRAVRDRQRRTLAYAEKLIQVRVPWTWVPIVQGQEVDDYVHMARRYRTIGMQSEYMGIGSLCSRRSAHEIRAIVAAVQEELPGTFFHLFGIKLSFFKLPGTRRLRCMSSDTAAWNGRFGRDIEEFNLVQQRRGWTQNATEIKWALPRYRQRFYSAIVSRV